jgi:hypothetical protein
VPIGTPVSPALLTTLLTGSLWALGPVAGAVWLAWEGGWWVARRQHQGETYRRALAHARALGRPLLVVGAPDAATTGGYGCGDVTVDLAPSSRCPGYLRADVTRPLPFEDGSHVVFVSCVLEYVSDPDAAHAELLRVAGGVENLYIVRVEPWTLAGHLYPGARQTLSPHAPGVTR